MMSHINQTAASLLFWCGGYHIVAPEGVCRNTHLPEINTPGQSDDEEEEDEDDALAGLLRF